MSRKSNGQRSKGHCKSIVPFVYLEGWNSLFINVQWRWVRCVYFFQASERCCLKGEKVAQACNLSTGGAENGGSWGLTDHHLDELARLSFSERHHFKKIRWEGRRHLLLASMCSHVHAFQHIHIHVQAHTHTTYTQSVASVFTKSQSKTWWCILMKQNQEEYLSPGVGD